MAKHSWHLSLANGENTRVDGVANILDEGGALTFENEAGETICMVNSGALVLAKRIEA